MGISFLSHPSLIVTSSGQRQDGELTKNLGRGKTSLQYLGIGFSFIRGPLYKIYFHDKIS